MKVCVVERYIVDPLSIVGFEKHVRKLWNLNLGDVIREIYQFEDNSGSIFIMETRDEQEARNIVTRFPLYLSALCTYEIFQLGSFYLLERLFGSNDPKILDQVNTPIKRLSTDSLRLVWVIIAPNNKFDVVKYMPFLSDYIVLALRYIKAGIIQNLYLVPSHKFSCMRMMVKDEVEASIYLSRFPEFRLGMTSYDIIKIRPYGFWELLPKLHPN